MVIDFLCNPKCLKHPSARFCKEVYYVGNMIIIYIMYDFQSEFQGNLINCKYNRVYWENAIKSCDSQICKLCPSVEQTPGITWN